MTPKSHKIKPPNKKNAYFSLLFTASGGKTSDAVRRLPPDPRELAKPVLTFSHRQYILGAVKHLTTRLLGTVKKVKRLFEAYYYGFSFAFFYEGTTTEGFAEPLHV